MKRKGRQLNVFSGAQAIDDFLNPDSNPYIPLVEVPESLNPFLKDGVHIFAKLMNMVPLMNVKSLPALNMLSLAKQRGKLKNVRALIENSSGNTVFSLATIARLFGIERTKAIVSHEVSWGKLQLLRLFGTEIMVNEEPICPDPQDKTSGIYKAKRMGNRKGWFNPGQYENEANPHAHERWTGPQVWEQTEGAITLFCAGLGTTGTLFGAGKYLKKQNPVLRILGVARIANNPVPGVRTQNLLREIAFDWKSVVDYVEEVGTKESFEKSLALCRAGIVAGPSSGFALAGLLRFLKAQKEKDGFDSMRNKKGRVIAVFVCPDSPLPYLDEYFEYLDDSHFPAIENENLLIHAPHEKKQSAHPSYEGIPEVSAEEAYELIYNIPQHKAWDLVNHDRKIPMREGVVVFDMRAKDEFAHFHLSGSLHKYTDQVQSFTTKNVKRFKKKKVFLICKFGERTKALAVFLRTRGIEAFTIQGGATEWSRLNLPRWRAEVCRVSSSTARH